ncbi:hypothetical protein [Sphingomonas leidyi]|uniref:hypothetical protein n=1 Tax=Sphingomonas leidyi TaxID=68569 RepID=UPI0036D35384
MKVYNRVKVGVSSTGTGNLYLAEPFDGFQSFSDGGVAGGAVVSYVLEDGPSWEVGRGTYDAINGRLTGRTVLQSSNEGDPIDASAMASVLLAPNAADYAGLPDPSAPAWPGTQVLCIDSGIYYYEKGRIIRELTQPEIDALFQSGA